MAVQISKVNGGETAANMKDHQINTLVSLAYSTVKHNQVDATEESVADVTPSPDQPEEPVKTEDNNTEPEVKTEG